jgi:hypothetical protein
MVGGLRRSRLKVPAKRDRLGSCWPGREFQQVGSEVEQLTARLRTFPTTARLLIAAGRLLGLSASQWTIGTLDADRKGATEMNNIFYIVGVVVVVLILLGYFGLR